MSGDFLSGKPHSQAMEGEKNAAVEIHFIKFSSKLMRHFDGAKNYYSITVCCDGKCLCFETEIIPFINSE